MSLFSALTTKLAVALGGILVAGAIATAPLAQTTTTTTTTPMAAPSAPALTELKLDVGLTPDMVARGQQLQTDMVRFGYDEDDVDDWCATRRDIRNGLIRSGFNEMDVVGRLTQFRVRVEALYLHDGWVYSMLVNRCTGEVTQLQPIYMASDVI